MNNGIRRFGYGRSNNEILGGVHRKTLCFSPTTNGASLQHRSLRRDGNGPAQQRPSAAVQIIWWGKFRSATSTDNDQTGQQQNFQHSGCSLPSDTTGGRKRALGTDATHHLPREQKRKAVEGIVVFNFQVSRGATCVTIFQGPPN